MDFSVVRQQEASPETEEDSCWGFSYGAVMQAVSLSAAPPETTTGGVAVSAASRTSSHLRTIVPAGYPCERWSELVAFSDVLARGNDLEVFRNMKPAHESPAEREDMVNVYVLAHCAAPCGLRVNGPDSI